MSASTSDRSFRPAIKTATLHGAVAAGRPSPFRTPLLNPGRVRDAHRFDLGFTSRHVLAVPFGCILLLALPCLALWASATPMLRWKRACAARRLNAPFLKDRR